jgi:hypothetical protein
MASDRSFGSLFGKAKQWATQELKNATSVTGEPAAHRRADEANDQLARHVEDEAEQLVSETLIEAMLPTSIKEYRDHAEADRERRRTESEERARTDRSKRAGASAVVLTGALTGSAEGLAVEAWLTEPASDLAVAVEAVDPVHMQGGTFVGFNFSVPGYHGDDRYELVDSPEFDGLQYEFYVAEENDGWCFHPTYGPGSIIIADGVADVRLTIGNAGGETVALSATIVLGAIG